MMPRMPHVTWEFVLENPEGIKNLSDKEFIEKFVYEFCKEFELTVLEPKLNYQFNGEKPEENGITAFYILSESGIHIQTWPEYKYGFIDVFSCKHFDEKLATRFIRNAFGKGKYIYDIVWRGTVFKIEEKKECMLTTKEMEKSIKEKDKLNYESFVREKRIKINKYRLRE